jgi:myosin heavy subunit
MANPVTTKLKQLSDQYSAKVNRIRELKAALKKPFVSDADAKKMNQELNKLNGEIESDFQKLTEAKRLEKKAKEYTSLQAKIKEKQVAINKAENRGESTTQLKSDQKDLTDSFNSIAPDVERTFPEIKVTPAKSTKTGPLGNVQLSTGTSITQTAEPKRPQGPGKISEDVIVGEEDPVTLAKIAAAKTKALGAKSRAEVLAADYAQRNAGIATVPKTPTGTKTATGDEDINAIYALARSKQFLLMLLEILQLLKMIWNQTSSFAVLMHLTGLFVMPAHTVHVMHSAENTQRL